MSSYRHVVLPVTSKALQGNPWGDPHERSLHVLVPSDADAGEPLPVVWILGGYGGTAEQILADDPWSEGFQRRVERLSREGELPPAIFVFPDCFTALGGSQFLSSPALGDYEAFIWEDCLSVLEENFACGAHGMAGRSSGGYGALLHALRHPDRVQAVACHAGDMAFEYCYLPGFPVLADAIRRHGGVREMVDAFLADTKKRSGKWFGPIQTLCMAAAYSPDPSAPLGIGLPFDPETAAIVPEVWERWLAMDPVRLADEAKNVERWAALRLLFLDCGDRDEYYLQWGQRQLVAKLRRQGVPHEAEEFPDGHRSTSYRYDVSLPKLVHALRGE